MHWESSRLLFLDLEWQVAPLQAYIRLSSLLAITHHSYSCIRDAPSTWPNFVFAFGVDFSFVLHQLRSIHRSRCDFTEKKNPQFLSGRNPSLMITECNNLLCWATHDAARSFSHFFMEPGNVFEMKMFNCTWDGYDTPPVCLNWCAPSNIFVASLSEPVPTSLIKHSTQTLMYWQATFLGTMNLVNSPFQSWGHLRA